ncbi:MAG: hypothetical protein RL376_1885 [Verrucomicrobiota bacterium]|jgi:hypothetical protein
MKSHSLLLATLTALLTGSQASAHIGWSGSRNFDTLTPGVTETSSDRTISSAFGWADATDTTQGDSHRNTYFRFTLADTTSVAVSAQRNDLITQTGTSGVFLPALSLFRIGTGVMPASTHDSAVASITHLTTTFGTSGVAETFTDANTDTFWNPGESFTDANGNGVWDSAGLGNSGKEGSLNALADWKMYNDAGDLADFRYIGHLADGTSANYGMASGITGDGVADGLINITFNDLVAGEYFVVVGGANYADQATYASNTSTFLTYGIAVSVTAIPEPASFAALAGLGMLGFASLRRRR